VQISRCLSVLILLATAACSKAAPPPATPATSASAQQATPGESSSDATPLLSASLLEGRDYVVLPKGKPLDTPAGQVEVAEFFNYACPACSAFEPHLAKWKSSLPGYVHVIYLPLDFRPDFVPYARGYFAAQALGVADKAHEAVYAAIHETHKLPGEGPPASADVLAQFYTQFGADPERFKELMGSNEISIKLADARDFAKRSGVHSTPTLLIDGKYVVRGDSWDNLLQNASQLIGKERE
jgi:thiol:disulfide interchange protein DsbA